MTFQEINKTALSAMLAEMRQKYSEYQGMGLKLDMSRGKPGADQLDISEGLFDDSILENGLRSADGTDCRNYGVLDGIKECKCLFAEILDVPEENIIIGGNSSLNLMFDYISQCMTHGAGSDPWMKQEKIKFICPVPGYDRHFAILEYFGIEMINVEMLEGGPNMAEIKELVKDSSVKGMICVPKYSNPEGKTFSNECVAKIAALKPAAEDFRIIWDNAYCVHDLDDEGDKLLNIFDECVKCGSEDTVIEVASTSKVSFPGAGVAAIAASKNNITAIKKRMFVQTIGHDKINQLRHAAFFENAQGMKNHMRHHAEILAPKFEAVLEALEKELAGTGTANWNRPKGGYFISLDVTEGCAKRVVQLCKEAGVILTGAGATFPYGKDPKDKNIRIAPTFPPVDELKTAVSLLCLCVKIASAEKILGE